VGTGVMVYEWQGKERERERERERIKPSFTGKEMTIINLG